MSSDLRDIDFVYFDLDDTLLDHRGAQDGAIASVVEKYAAEFGGVSTDVAQRMYAEVNARAWGSYVRGDIGKSELGVARFGAFLEALDADGLSADVVSKDYMEAYIAGGWQELPGAISAFLRISRLRPVGIITNGLLEVQRSKLASYPMLARVSHTVIISEEFGVMKPDPGLFDVAWRRAGVSAERIMHIGDSLESDVRGAMRAGWQAVWYGAGDDREEPGARSLGDWDSFCR